MRLTIVICILLLMAISHAYAASVDVVEGPVAIEKGFLTGEEFLKLSEIEKVSYSMGIVDGYLSAPAFGGKPKYVKWLSVCVQGKTNTQLSAILSKYLQDNPGRWNKSVQHLMFEALWNACVK